jgi:hypothetical protein
MLRRTCLVACVAMLAAVVWLCAPALSRGPYVPHAEDFSMALPELGARAATASVHTPVYRAPRRFDLVGLHWRSGHGTVSMRFRETGGRWTKWVATGGSADHAPDGERAPLGTDPVWVGGADEMQMIVRGSIRGVRAHFENTTGTSTAAQRAKTAIRRAVHSAFVAAFATPVARAQDSSRPDIIPRSQWGGDQCPPRHTPNYGTIKAAFVHHTVNANDYAPQDSAAIVLAICRFHRNTNGWDDIGYNFLVDRYGQIFEGRAGGVDKAVQGAHTQGYNAQSFAISNMGTFTDVPETDVAIRAQARLIAWKMALAKQPVTGKVTLISAGGGSNRFPAGTRVTLDRISGHRDANNTGCPGDALYAQLPEIRRLAAGDIKREPASVTTGLSAAVGGNRLPYPNPAELSGRFLLPDGRPAMSAALDIEFRVSGGAFRSVAEALTNSDGTWFSSVPATRSGFYRARYPGDADFPSGFVSPPVAVTVVPRLTVAASALNVVAGSRVVLKGSIGPAKPRLLVQIERLDNGRYHLLGDQPVKTASGRYRAVVNIGTARRYRLRVVFRSDRLNPTVRSAAVLVRGVRPVRSGGTAAQT